MSHNLQRVEENGDNIKFYWINFVTSLLFLCKQFYNSKLKVIIVISSLIHLTIAYNALSILFINVNVVVNLKNSPTNKFLTIKVLHITYKINKFSTNMHLKLLTMSKIKCRSNHLCLKMAKHIHQSFVSQDKTYIGRHFLPDSKSDVIFRANNYGI